MSTAVLFLRYYSGESCGPTAQIRVVPIFRRDIWLQFYMQDAFELLLHTVRLYYGDCTLQSFALLTVIAHLALPSSQIHVHE